MKNSILPVLLSFFTSTLVFSQSITILDESPQTSYSGSSIIDFVVFDNDIIYTKNIATTGFNPLTRINYGVPNEYVNFDLQGSFGFSQNTTPAESLFYETTQKKIGSKIILQSAINGPYNGTIFSLNNSRSDVVIEPDFNNTFSQIGKDLAISTRVVESESGIDDYIAIKLHTPTEIQEFALPTYLTTGQPGAYFLWDNNIYFTANDGSGGRELFKTDAFQTNRVTKLRIPTATNSVSPSSIYKKDPEKLYFNGNYRTFNLPPQTGNTNFGRELCYTTGNPNLGNSTTHMEGNDDGSTGYIAFQTGVPSPTNYSGASPIILGMTNDKLIYYATNNYMRKFYSHPGNIDLMLETPQFPNLGDLEYLEHNGKVFISYLPQQSPPVLAAFYQTDGTPEGTTAIQIPTIVSGGSVVESRRIRDLFVHNQKIYYRAFYNSSNVEIHFVEYDPATEQSTILFQFPENSGEIVKPYTSGFVFNGNGKLYGWNIETRAAVMPLSIDEPLQTIQLEYNGVTYNFGLDTLQTIPIPDQLKINLLDYFSIPYEFIVNQDENQGRMEEEDVQLSKLFYSLTAFDENTFFNTNLTLGYDESMFDAISTINPNHLSVKAFSNGEWTSKNIINVNEINKTVTINETFSNEEYLFFEYDETLSLSENQPSKITIYPNPASEMITVNLPEKANYEVSINDISGKKIAAYKLSNTTTFNISQLASGLYIIKIQKEDGVSYNHKLIVN